MPTPSRGNCITAYSAPFSKGAQVYGAQIASGAITSAHIADGTIMAADVANGSITSAKLGTGAVTSVKLGAASVISAKIGAAAVQAANLAAGSVTSAKLGTASVTNAKMKAAFLSGTISGGLAVVRAVAHGLGVKPKSVIVCGKLTVAQMSAKHSVQVSQASAATSANIYLVSSFVGNINYAAYVQI